MSTLRSILLSILGRFWLGVFGWKVKSDVPAINKFVMVGAPHTSNWDFPMALAMFYSQKIKLSWMGKDALFKPPMGYLMKAVGGIAINRNSQHGVVEQMAEKFQQADHLIVGIAAKGTRKKTEYWKSGFYWIAYNANVPVVCCYLDYKNKLACIGSAITLTGNVKGDMDKIRAFFQGVEGRKPEYADNILLKEET